MSVHRGRGAADRWSVGGVGRRLNPGRAPGRDRLGSESPLARGQDAAGGVAQAVSAVAPGIPREFRNVVFLEILVFVAILAAAFAHAWKKGVFEWR